MMTASAATDATLDLLGCAERAHHAALDSVGASSRAKLGQFFTPPHVAELLASCSHVTTPRRVFLDAGAGVGILSAAWVQAQLSREPRATELEVAAFEIEPLFLPHLESVLRECGDACEDVGVQFRYTIHNQDFIQAAVDNARGGFFVSDLPRFDSTILNPPYRKFRSDSAERALLREVGLEISNLYAAFVALAARLLRPGGELIAITPRSFCNGPYFREFRRDLLSSSNLTHVHVIDSRAAAFARDAVLQENVIFRVECGRQQQESVSLEWSRDGSLLTTDRRAVPFSDVVRPNDPDRFIHIAPDEWDDAVAGIVQRLPASLADLDVQVSTGRVVDFRAREHLRMTPEPDTIPLLYPVHFYGHTVRWPANSRKPNALVLSPDTAELTSPTGTYVLTKRFTAKEERRRLVAAILTPESIPGSLVAFENHLNYFHRRGVGLPRYLAIGLAAYLNSSIADRYFRRFSGHTQVNATDLRKLPYPSEQQLESIGRRLNGATLTEEQLNDAVEEEIIAVEKAPRRGKRAIQKKLREASQILAALGLPKEQQNERAALTLLALLDLPAAQSWQAATNPLRGVTPIMGFAAKEYGKHWKPNTRETVRRFTLHQFEAAGLVVSNPDRPDRPINSPSYCYQAPATVLALIRAFGSSQWEPLLRAYLASADTLRAQYAREREMQRIPVRVREGQQITLSPGGQNALVRAIIADFCSRFTPGASVLYVGDADKKWAYFDSEALAALGVKVTAHGKMPDVVVHFSERNWLVVVEAVTSHGPINPKRRGEIRRLFRQSAAPLVLVTAFLTRRTLNKYLADIAWETEVWVAETPTHLIHFNGERFLGPYEE